MRKFSLSHDKVDEIATRFLKMGEEVLFAKMQNDPRYVAWVVRALATAASQKKPGAISTEPLRNKKYPPLI